MLSINLLFESDINVTASLDRYSIWHNNNNSFFLSYYVHMWYICTVYLVSIPKLLLMWALQTPSFTVHLLAAKNVLVHLLIEVILGPCVAPNEAHKKPTNKIYYGKLTVEFARTLGGSPFSRRTCVNTSANPSREVSSSSLSSSLSVSLMRACRV